MRTLFRRTEGLSVTELVIVMAILAVITSIAAPLFFSQQSAAYKATAIADGRAWSLSLLDSLRDVRNYGDTGGTMSLVGSDIQLSMINPTPASATTVFAPVAVSPETSLVDGFLAGNNWCFTVANQGEQAVFTQQGYRSSALGCASDGTATTN